jgi:hypothetical protein
MVSQKKSVDRYMAYDPRKLFLCHCAVLWHLMYDALSHLSLLSPIPKVPSFVLPADTLHNHSMPSTYPGN